MKKSTVIERETRIKVINQLQLKGYSRPDILEYANKTWGIATSTTDDLVRDATKRLREVNKVAIEDTLAVITANYWDQYRIAKEAKNGLLCVMVLRELSKLKGLDQQHIHLTVEKVDPELEKLTPDQITQMLEEDDE